MTKTAPDKVLLKGAPNRFQRDAAAAITPGQLLQINSTNKVQRHATSRGAHIRWFAVERDYVGDDLDVSYSANQAVEIQSARPGEVINGLLKDGETAVIGSKLVSGGNGDLIVDPGSSATDGDNTIVGIALTALDLSDSSGADPSSRRIQVLIV